MTKLYRELIKSNVCERLNFFQFIVNNSSEMKIATNLKYPVKNN